MFLDDIAPSAEHNPELGLLFASLEDGTREWRGELGDVSIEQLVWQPFPGGHSVGGLLLHIADVEGWWIETVLAGRERSEEEVRQMLSEETKQSSVEWPTPPAEPFAYYDEILQSVRRRTRETLREFPDAAARVRYGDENEFTPRWILSHVVQHDSYHGGQAVLLKLMHERMTNR